MTHRPRRGYEEREDHDRWMVSYADFITLLFAFFVVMYAISSLNEGRYRVLSVSLADAFGAATVSLPTQKRITQSAIPNTSNTNTPVDEVQKKQIAHLRDVADRILKVLAPLIKDGTVQVSRGEHGIAIEINAAVLFMPGQANLEPVSFDALKTMIAVLKDLDDTIQVEGHTDNTPIATSQFPSNWELSTARASSVVRFFMSNGIAPGRLAASGYAEFRPLQNNDSPENRARNRRVTLFIIPKKN